MQTMANLNFVQWFIVVTITVVSSVLFSALIVIRAEKILMHQKARYHQAMAKMLLDGLAAGLTAMGNSMVKKATEEEKKS